MLVPGSVSGPRPSTRIPGPHAPLMKERAMGRDGHCLMRAFKLERAISTGKLHALRRFHTRPINVVVFHGS